MMRLTPMVKNILIINFGIFLLQAFMNLPFEDLFGLRVVFSDEFKPFQFVSYMWIHHDFRHIFGNMLAVFFFGPMLEHVWGSKRFLTFYLICGIGAAVLFGGVDFIEKYPMRQDYMTFLNDPTPEQFEHFILDYRVSPRYTEMLAEFSTKYYASPESSSYISQAKTFVSDIYTLYANGGMVGASGAVFGILMAFAMLFPNTEILLWFVIPVKAKYIVLAYGLYELYSEFAASATDNIAHLAHLGGMLIAFILLKIWQKDNRRFY